MKLKWQSVSKMVSFGPHTRGMRIQQVDEARYAGYVAAITPENVVLIHPDDTTPATYGGQRVSIHIHAGNRESAQEFAVATLKALEKVNA